MTVGNGNVFEIQSVANYGSNLLICLVIIITCCFSYSTFSQVQSSGMAVAWECGLWYTVQLCMTIYVLVKSV